VGHGQLLLGSHTATRRLFAIAESGVEEGDVILVVYGHEFARQGKPVANLVSVSHPAGIRQSYSFWVVD
jgi:hypothetical protein